MIKHTLTSVFFSFFSLWIFSQSVYWEQMGQDMVGPAPHNSGDLYGKPVSFSDDGLTFAASEIQYYTAKGRVFVYEWDGAQWIQKGADIEGDNTTDNFGTYFSLSGDGNRIAIGSPANDNAGTNRGQVRILEWDGTQWVQLGSDIYGKSSSEFIGGTLSMSGDGNTVIIGQESYGINSANGGKVRVYRWDGTNWLQLGNDFLAAHGDEYFGWSRGNPLSLSDNGNTIAIGAHFNNTAGTGKGRVVIYDWDGSTWIQRGTDLYGDNGLDKLGYSVVLTPDGNSFVVGEPQNKAATDATGRVRVFDWDGSNWTARDNGIKGLVKYDYFGFATDITQDGNTFIATAGNSASTTESIRVFNWSSNQWNEVGKLTNDQVDPFTLSVAISKDGKKILLGAQSYKESGDTYSRGRIRAYKLCGEVAPTPDISSLPDINAECELTTLTPPTATDDCDHSLTGTHNATLPINTVGTTTITWTYTDPGGNSTTQTQDVIISPCPVGIVENIQELIELFPNPTFDKLTISSPNNITIELYSLSGEHILSKQNIQGEHVIDLTNYAQGIYILKAYNDNTSKVYRVIKN